MIFNKWRKNWKCWIPFVVIAAAAFILKQGIVMHRISSMREMTGISIVKNPIAYFVYSLYSNLWLLIWPAKLVFFHNPVVISKALDYYGIFLLLPIILLFALTFKKAKELFFGLSIFIIFLSPAYSPIPVTSLLAERYLYFPSIILSIFVAFVFERYRKKYKNYLLLALIFIIFAYGIRTILRNEDWKTPERFWKQTAEVSYDNPLAHNNIGAIYLEKGNIRGAIEEFEKAIKINPKFIRAYNNLGLAYDKLGDKEKAIYFLKKAIEINPNLATIYYNLGAIYNNLGNTKEAIALYNKVIKMDQRCVGAYNNLASIYIDIGENKEAIPLLKKALEINPHYALAHFNLSFAYFKEREYGLAVMHCDEARNLGYDVSGEFLKSLESYRGK